MAWETSESLSGCSPRISIVDPSVPKVALKAWRSSCITCILGAETPVALCAFISVALAGSLVGDIGVANIVGGESPSRTSEGGVDSGVGCCLGTFAVDWVTACGFGGFAFLLLLLLLFFPMSVITSRGPTMWRGL